MEEIRFTEAFSENLLTRQAYICGFLAFYPLRRTLEQPALFALLMPVLSHFALDYGAIRSEWLQKIGRLKEFLQLNPSFVHEVTPDFWREAIATMKEIALETLEGAEETELVAKLRSNERLSVSEGQEVVLIVGRRLQLRIVMLLEKDGALFMRDDCPETVPSLWTTIGVRENGDFYFFVDLNFRKGRECSRFPFYCENAQEIVAFQGFAVTRRQTEAEGNESDLRNRGPKHERETHAVEKCEEFGGDLVARECGHRFHPACLGQRMSVFQCPKCLGEASKSLPPNLNKRGPFSSSVSCDNCHQLMLTSSLLIHGDHLVCVRCLCDRNRCPKCEGELSEKDMEWVRKRA